MLIHLGPHKSMGQDGIQPRVIRGLSKELARPLSIILQQSWLSGKVPDDWKLTNVTPICEKGQKDDPENYRPASLTSGPSKVMEQIILSEIMTPTGWTRDQTQPAWIWEGQGSSPEAADGEFTIEDNLQEAVILPPGDVPYPEQLCSHQHGLDTADPCLFKNGHVGHVIRSVDV
ncbi:hypothetical protein WISP_105227 [Willisornis vidua]|uniref:RNA-directed DNA polymerase from mobile element jockey n=1 Tax=Willisornis vidua TaxID=1566151 RepID=A0ABQ9CXE2_9PASS|nr:hypothetical protein WISP_105227 [Willisornis vidua]